MRAVQATPAHNRAVRQLGLQSGDSYRYTAREAAEGYSC